VIFLIKIKKKIIPFCRFWKLRKFEQVLEVTEVWARILEFDQKSESFRQSQNSFARKITSNDK